MTATHVFGVLEDNIEVVTFLWSNEKGHCYECGCPAAFALSNEGPLRPEILRCSVCAAMAATEGSEIVWLFREDFD